MKILSYGILLILTLTIISCSDSNQGNDQQPNSPAKNNDSQTTIPATPQTKSCNADKSWFDAGFDPAKDASAFTGGSLCAFHQFSWQTFIWLTEKMADGSTRFDGLYADTAIVPDSSPGEHILGGVNQAGSNGILIDQNGRAVYTSMMVNDIYRSFVIDNKLYTKQGMQDAKAELNFPDGAMSLKASWKIIQAGEDTSGLFTMTAPVQLLEVVNGNVTVPPGAQQESMQVALVGFHIAVYVNNHPEAIWATFEQANNAPPFASKQSPGDPVSASNFTFYHGGTLAHDCNANNSGSNAILQLDTHTQVMKNVTQACLQFPFGTSDSSPQAVDNRNAIQHLNGSVHKLMPDDSIWKNYREVGAVWFSKANALTPDWNPNVDATLQIGSTRLSNTTIETFTQNVQSQNECFGCHNTMALTAVPENIDVLAGKNINTSHILLKNYIDGNVVKR